MQSSLVGSFVPLLEKLRFLNICYVLLVWSVGRSLGMRVQVNTEPALAVGWLGWLVGLLVGWLDACSV